MKDTTQQSLARDILVVLQYLLEKSHVHKDDAIIAAVNRIRSFAATDAERAAKHLRALRARRDAAFQQAARLAGQVFDFKQMAARPGATPNTKRRAAQLTAQHEAAVNQLNAVAAELVAAEKAEAA
jgi:hypothetical protein